MDRRPLADDLEDYAQNIVDTVREPLLTSRDRQLRVLGLSTIVAAVITHVTFRYAFTSVWCFFAALLPRRPLVRRSFHALLARGTGSARATPAGTDGRIGKCRTEPRPRASKYW